jgi:hypothetical protein
MTALLDARELASYLNLQPLHWHEDELLAVSTIAADDYALLAMMPTTSGWETDMTTSQGSITVPTEYWRNHCLSGDLIEALRLEIQSHTGWRHDRQLPWLVGALKTR